MSDTFYTLVRAVGSLGILVSARPTIRGLDNIPPRGPFILAATHSSPFDVPLLIRHTPRPLDFVSITEVFKNPLVAWFYGSMNAFPLDRSRPDAPTVRIILSRLEAGRAVAMFPEGRIQSGADSVVHTRKIRRGLGRIAHMTRAPVVPCVVINSAAYTRPTAWLPLRRVRYGIIYGPPIPPNPDPETLEAQYIDDIVRLHAQLQTHMTPPRAPQDPTRPTPKATPPL